LKSLHGCDRNRKKEYNSLLLFPQVFGTDIEASHDVKSVNECLLSAVALLR
jgi:hypothetical protein